MTRHGRAAGIAAAALLAAMPLSVARAEGECAVSVDVAGATDPHLVDPDDDGGGPVTGGPTLLGDVYREGTNVTAAWLRRDGEGTLSAHVQVQSLSVSQPNAIFYMLWDYEGGDALRRHRFASARLKAVDAAYSYGYFDEAAGRFATIGDTTGELVPGDAGEVVINLPKEGNGFDRFYPDDVVPNAHWGAPTDILTNISAESRLLVGSPEPLPPPAPVRHGYVFEVENSANAFFICDATV